MIARGRRFSPVAAALALALLASLALGATAAPAATTRVVEDTFTGDDTPGGPFGMGPFGGVALDHTGGPSSGAAYVGETNFFTTESRVVKFDATGTYAGVEFKGADTPAGSFSFLDFANNFEPGSLAVDSSSGPNSGNVYVADSAHGVVARFNDQGEFDCQISGKVPSSQAEEEAECAGATGSATPKEFKPTGVTVDPVDGDVYVGNWESEAVYRFNAAGEYVGQISDPRLTQPARLAIDSNGNLYVNNSSALTPGNVVKFDAAGAFDSVLTEKPIGGIAVNPTSDHVFVFEIEASQIAEYDPTGALLRTFEHKSEFAAAPLAASASDRVYAVSFSFVGSFVTIFGPPVILPDPFVKPPTDVEETSATLNGEVDPAGGGDVVTCEFEYGPDTSYGNSVDCSQATPYSGVTAVSAAIAGLNPSSTYHYRLAVANANGVKSFSPDEVLYTKGAPTVESQTAKEITRGSATIEATINPRGYSTDWKVEYVTQAQYEADGFTGAQATAPTTIGAQLTPQTVSAQLTDLQVETTYHYRIVATNSVDSVTSSEQTFTTVPVVEFLGLKSNGEVTTALMRETVNPLGLATSCHVEYVKADSTKEVPGEPEPDWSNATTVPCNPQDLGSGSTPVRIRTTITGLAVDSAYHTRFVFTNASGTVRTPRQKIVTFGLEKFEMEALDEEGNPVTQAGAHPYELYTDIEVNENPNGGSTSTLKDILTELPPGLIGNPNGLPQCTQRQMLALSCPGNTQVGAIAVTLVGEERVEDPNYAPVFNLVPPRGVAARFGANINIGIAAYIEASVRTGGDHGINADSLSITSFANAGRIQLKMWGVPGDPGHTEAKERSCPEGSGYEKGCSPEGLSSKPFLSMPTSCTGEPMVARAAIIPYQSPQTKASLATSMPGMTGCEALEFDPGFEARPTTSVADAPTGLHVEIDVPQNEEEEGEQPGEEEGEEGEGEGGTENEEEVLGLRVADLRDAKVTLPPGLVINPSGANGLVGCSSAAFDGPGPGQCPEAAKIGTVEVDTPLINHTLPGSIYVAQPYDNPFNSLLAIYLEVNDLESGVIIKLPGHVQPDPETGQLTTTFDENPQLPFNSFRLDFFKGAKAPLRTAPVCGVYESDAVLTPWSAPASGPAAELSRGFTISRSPAGGACPTSPDALPNRPTFEAGTVSALAGVYSPFVMRLRRDDGSQEFKNLTMTPPPGLLARLAGTAYCPDASLAAAATRPGADEAASPSCPANSEVGSVNVGAGAGPAPYYVNGRVYLAGPYRGAPLSLAIVTPATAGPYDLGTVVVRVALHVHPETTRITAVADPLPHILKGIPLDIRSIRLELGKPQFTVNPTSCNPATLVGQLTSTLGQPLSLSNPFQLGNCTNLAFRPKLSTQLIGKSRRGANPAFRALLTMPPGHANIARAAVTLPPSEFLDQAHIRTVCTRVQYAAAGGGGAACPPGSIYGYARAWSPLLDQPLQGPVFLRSSSNKLPDLVASLRGQIQVDLAGRIDSAKGRIRTSFEMVPDAPVSKFMLTMKGRGKGLLENSTNICRGDHYAIASFEGHNGATEDFRSRLTNRKCKKAKQRPGRSAGKRRGGESKARGA